MSHPDYKNPIKEGNGSYGYGVMAVKWLLWIWSYGGEMVIMDMELWR